MLPSPLPDPNPMKIHQLPDGARFEYKGEEYVKTGPMFGTGPDGPQLIPRSAVLRPLGEQGNARDSGNELVARTKVLRAFNAFYAECRALVPGEQQRELELLHGHFLASLGGGR